MDINTCLDVNTYRVRSMWQARVETPAAIANRFRTFLALSRPALPPDRRWYTQEEPGGPVDIDLTRDPAGIDRLLAKVQDRDSDGQVWVGSGSFTLVFAPLDGGTTLTSTAEPAARHRTTAPSRPTTSPRLTPAC